MEKTNKIIIREVNEFLFPKDRHYSLEELIYFVKTHKKEIKIWEKGMLLSMQLMNLAEK